MKVSKYNISQDYKGKTLLYNSLSTSMVEVDSDMYENIFCARMYKMYLLEVNALAEMGFLIDDSTDEGEEQRAIRQTVIDNNSGKIANIIIAPTMECNAHCFIALKMGFVREQWTIGRRTH